MNLQLRFLALVVVMSLTPLLAKGENLESGCDVGCQGPNCALKCPGQADPTPLSPNFESFQEWPSPQVQQPASSEPSILSLLLTLFLSSPPPSMPTPSYAPQMEALEVLRFLLLLDPPAPPQPIFMELGEADMGNEGINGQIVEADITDAQIEGD